LRALFRKHAIRWGNDIAQMEKNEEAVLKDISSFLNLPFVITTKQDQKTALVKTVMRKDDFKSYTPILAVENKRNKSMPKPTSDDDIKHFIRKTRQEGWKVYVSRVDHRVEGAFRLEFEMDEEEFEIIGKDNEWELFSSGPTLSGRGKMFDSIEDAFAAATALPNTMPLDEAEMQAAWNLYQIDDVIRDPREAFLLKAMKYLDREISSDKSKKLSPVGHAYDIVRQFDVGVSPRKLLDIYQNWKQSGELVEAWLDDNLSLLEDLWNENR